MNGVLLIARREWNAYFRSPIAAVGIAACLLIQGVYFHYMALTQKKLTGEALEEYFYVASGTTMAFALVMTMRLLAEERQTGTLTLLATSPLKDWQVVQGKYLAALAMILVLSVVSSYMPGLLFVNGKVSIGHLLVGYLGLVLLGSATASIGLFASSLTRHQVVALIIGALLTAVLLVLWMIARATDPPINEYLSALALWHDNFTPFRSGILKPKPAVYYVAMTCAPRRAWSLDDGARRRKEELGRWRFLQHFRHARCGSTLRPRSKWSHRRQLCQWYEWRPHRWRRAHRAMQRCA